MFVCVPHALLLLFSRPQAALVVFIGAHNVLKAGKTTKKTPIVIKTGAFFDASRTEYKIYLAHSRVGV